MITLQPITIKFEHTEEFDIEAYLEWCMDCGIQPSQKHYKKWTVDCLVDSLTDNINTDEFQFIYDDPQEVEYNESEEDEVEETFSNESEEDEVEETFSYAPYVSDLTEEELQEFHYLCENDKMILSPAFCKGNIVIMNSCDNPRISYGMIIDEDGEILNIKKSINHHHMFCYLKNCGTPD